MALIAPRDMPVIEARWSPLDRRWLIHLPGNLTMPARDEAAVEWLVDRLAPGSSIRFVRDVLRGGADAQQPPGAGTGSTSEHITHTAGE